MSEDHRDGAPAVPVSPGSGPVGEQPGAAVGTGSPGAEVRAPTGPAVAVEAPGGTGPGELSPARLRAALEAVLVVAEDPLDAQDVATALEVPLDAVETALTALEEEYVADERGLRLRRTALGWRLWSAPEHDDVVQRVLVAGRQGRLSQAALETLAVVAYRQPVTRGRVSAIRGVSVDGVMRTLVVRGLVIEDGQEAGATLYRTSPLFLERLGLQSLEDLPPIAPLLPETEELDELST